MVTIVETANETFDPTFWIALEVISVFLIIFGFIGALFMYLKERKTKNKSPGLGYILVTLASSGAIFFVGFLGPMIQSAKDGHIEVNYTVTGIVEKVDKVEDIYYITFTDDNSEKIYFSNSSAISQTVGIEITLECVDSESIKPVGDVQVLQCN